MHALFQLKTKLKCSYTRKKFSLTHSSHSSGDLGSESGVPCWLGLCEAGKGHGRPCTGCCGGPGSQGGLHSSFHNPLPSENNLPSGIRTSHSALHLNIIRFTSVSLLYHSLTTFGFKYLYESGRQNMSKP